MNCPKDAIRFKKNGQAEIDHDTCISCGKCHQNCPYHAIVYIPIPCEEVCPVKAISKDEYGVEHIDESKCIYCGKCLNACPFGAIFDQCAVFDVLNRIKEGRQVVAMVAPSVLAQFKQPVEKVFGALKAIGFSDVLEVAYGAEETIRREAEEFKEKLESGAAFMTTSCCSAYVQLALPRNHALRVFYGFSHVLRSGICPQKTSGSPDGVHRPLRLQKGGRTRESQRRLRMDVP